MDIHKLYSDGYHLTPTSWRVLLYAALQSHHHLKRGPKPKPKPHPEAKLLL